MSPTQHAPTPSRLKALRRIAIVSGLIGLLCFVSLPFLAVKQTETSVEWPQGGSLQSVTAPLMAHVPQQIDASIPCELAGELPEEGGVLVATAPPGTPEAGERSMAVRATSDVVELVSRNRVILSQPREAVAAGECTNINLQVTSSSTSVDFEGMPGAARTIDGEDIRPSAVGVYTDLDPETVAPAGLSVTIDVDSRFTSDPTVLKWLAMIVGVIATLVSLWALHGMDRTDGRRSRRVLPRGWFQFRLPDAAVIGTLGVWHFIGGNTSDDGYILTMARAAAPADYMANYYRWYGVPESPFGSPYYDLLALMSQISTASPWIRLPTLIAAILCWLVISREVLPRLGRAVRSSPIAVWSSAAVFVAFWMAFNNGLRPEPIIALGALLTWTSVERAIATRRLLPAAIAVILASFSLAAGPTGLMAVAALLLGIRPILRSIVKRSRRVGGSPLEAYTALLAPILASGTAVLISVFANQTMASVLEAIRVRGLVGPSLPWHQEFVRYYYLMIDAVDGSLARRLPVLLLGLCVVVVLAYMLRHGRVAGAASGPSWRLLGVLFGTAFFLMFSPTKWTHHFGVYAGIGAAVVALGAMAIANSSLNSARNRTVFLGVVLIVMAVSFAGPNGWWYVSSYGIPWWDKSPSFQGIEASSVLFGLAILVFLYAAWQHLRQDFTGTPRPETVRRRRRAQMLTAAPIAIVAGLLVVFNVASFVKGIQGQLPAYTIAEGNVRAVAGEPCMLADEVMVEPDANAGMLAPLDGDGSPESIAESLEAGQNTGFDPNGVSTDLEADAVVAEEGAANTTSDPGSGPSVSTGQAGGTAGGVGDQGVNGSTVALPFGLDPARTPVLGSFQSDAQQESTLLTGWYELPENRENTPLIAVSAAGRIGRFDADGLYRYGQDVTFEFGQQTGGSEAEQVGEPVMAFDIGPAPAWRNLRVPMESVPEEADVMRIRVEDYDLTPDQWAAITPPRAAEVTSLNEYVGADAPVLIDWAVSLQFPCQRPFEHYGGVAELPEFRIHPDRPLSVSSTSTWQSYEGGGPLGWIELALTPQSVPSYLTDDLNRDWGTLERYHSRQTTSGAPAEADLTLEEDTRWGWWEPQGPIMVTHPL